MPTLNEILGTLKSLNPGDLIRIGYKIIGLDSSLTETEALVVNNEPNFDSENPRINGRISIKHRTWDPTMLRNYIISGRRDIEYFQVETIELKKKKYRDPREGL